MITDDSIDCIICTGCLTAVMIEPVDDEATTIGPACVLINELYGVVWRSIAEGKLFGKDAFWGELLWNDGSLLDCSDDVNSCNDGDCFVDVGGNKAGDTFLQIQAHRKIRLIAHLLLGHVQ